MRSYRGLTVKTRRWAYGWYCKVENKHFIVPDDAEVALFAAINEECITGFVEVIPETVGQATGLTDKNGKEIYKGDIVTFRPEPGSCGIVGNINGENAMVRIVVWLEDDARFGWELPSGNRNQSGYSFCKKCEDIFEVIGSTHENPELLGEKAE